MIRRSRRARPKRRERGASIFIVVLVITVLTAVGIFAARNAAQVNIASGHARQAMQALYFAEMGTDLGIGQVNEAPGIARNMADNSEDFRENACRVNNGVPGLQCYRYLPGEILPSLENKLGSSITLIDPQTDTNPGSFGPALIEADSTAGLTKMNQGRTGEFIVELSDAYRADTVAGNDEDSETVKVYFASITGYGQVRTTPNTVVSGDPWCGNQVSARTATIGAVRAYIKFVVVD